jgi:hypothetical protein
MSAASRSVGTSEGSSLTVYKFGQARNWLCWVVPVGSCGYVHPHVSIGDGIPDSRKAIAA